MPTSWDSGTSTSSKRSSPPPDMPHQLTADVFLKAASLVTSVLLAVTAVAAFKLMREEWRKQPRTERFLSVLFLLSSAAGAVFCFLYART